MDEKNLVNRVLPKNNSSNQLSSSKSTSIVVTQIEQDHHNNDDGVNIHKIQSLNSSTDSEICERLST